LINQFSQLSCVCFQLSHRFVVWWRPTQNSLILYLFIRKSKKKQ